MTLNIIDVAGSYQPVSVMANYINSIAGAVCKASEGQQTAISEHDTQVAYLRSKGKVVGHYHYAWPEHSGETEANWFLKNAKAQPGDTLWLDFEPYKSSAPASAWPAYIVSFANTVHAATGAWPGIYLNDYHAGLVVSNASASQLSVIRNLPLWKAGVNGAYVSSPSNGPGNTHGWATCTMFQWTDTPIDKDVFYGDVNAWHALGVPSQGGNTTVTATNDQIYSLEQQLSGQEADRYSDLADRDNAIRGDEATILNYLKTALPQRYLASDGTVSFDPTKGTPIRYLDAYDGKTILDAIAALSAQVTALGTPPAATVDYNKITDAVNAAVSTLGTLTGTVNVAIHPQP